MAETQMKSEIVRVHTWILEMMIIFSVSGLETYGIIINSFS